MIALRRINGREFILNADLIESIESTPDTMITLTSGKKVIVLNKVDDIVRKSIKYKQLYHQSLQVIQPKPPIETIALATGVERSA
jgi:flagellar protein FlbD